MGERLPNPEQFDFLIILGGPQSLMDQGELLTLSSELKLIEHSIALKKLVLGICLGAQMIAECFGMKTVHSPYPEIGLYPVILSDEGAKDRIFSDFPREFIVTHMHLEMVELPQTARLLASSSGCPIQAFAIGNKVYGLQFHLEITKENINIRLNYLTEELGHGPYIFTRDELSRGSYYETNQKMYLLLNNITSNDEPI